jgi:hypothetical protein
MKVDAKGNICEDPDRCVHGVPAMVKVPTHIEVKIVQTDYWKIEEIGTSPKKLVHLPSATLRSVDISEVCVNKLVMIDPKRPASGSGSFAIEYDGDGKGVIKTINYKAVDETIKNSAALAAAALKAFGVKTGTETGSTPDMLANVKRTIAIKRFPVGRCSQGEIESFVAQYINLCAPEDCTTSTSYAK